MYKGVIQKSRTIDLAVINKIVDTGAATFLLYSPEQLGLTVPVYFGVRIVLNSVAIYLRHKTTGPVGQK